MRAKLSGIMVFRIQPHSRLQEWVAEEKGYFAATGLDYEFVTSFASSGLTTSAVRKAEDAPIELRRGAFEDMQAGRACDVSSACHWAVNAAATGNNGRMWGHAYSMCVSGIMVQPESSIRTPDDLANTEIGVGYHSGSHYSAIQALEPFLQREQIKLKFVGLPNDRVRLMLDRKLPSANVFGAQYYLLEQLGFHKIVDTTFMMGFLVSGEASTEELDKYFRALRQAQRDIDLEAEKYKHYWLREMPEDLRAVADPRRFGPGERIVFELYTREMFEQTHRWMSTWDLFTPEQAQQARPFEEAVLV
jgi:NitT/TauT family transport system substrate-binding protein